MRTGPSDYHAWSSVGGHLGKFQRCGHAEGSIVERVLIGLNNNKIPESDMG